MAKRLVKIVQFPDLTIGNIYPSKYLIFSHYLKHKHYVLEIQCFSLKPFYNLVVCKIIGT